MIRRRNMLVALATVVVVAALIAALNVKAIRQAWHRRAQDRDAAYLAQNVDGYLPQDWQEMSSVVVRQIGYHGALVVEYRWSKLGSQCRRYQGWPDATPPEWSSPVQVSGAAARAISDAMNIAVRDRLWQRGDITRKGPDNEVIADGGEAVYEFVLGPNKGALRLIHGPNLPDLRLFVHKVGIWTEDVRRQFRAGDPRSR